MRLWHKDLIRFLPKQQLLGQHRECCALRGNGWGKKHSTVDYVFTHSYSKLYFYHVLVMREISYRGCKVSPEWLDYKYRGKVLGYDTTEFTEPNDLTHYVEHNDEYFDECIKNLASKGIYIEFIETEDE